MRSLKHTVPIGLVPAVCGAVKCLQESSNYYDHRYAYMNRMQGLKRRGFIFAKEAMMMQRGLPERELYAREMSSLYSRIQMAGNKKRMYQLARRILSPHMPAVKPKQWNRNLRRKSARRCDKHYSDDVDKKRSRNSMKRRPVKVQKKPEKIKSASSTDRKGQQQCKEKIPRKKREPKKKTEKAKSRTSTVDDIDIKRSLENLLKMINPTNVAEEVAVEEKTSGNKLRNIKSTASNPKKIEQVPEDPDLIQVVETIEEKKPQKVKKGAKRPPAKGAGGDDAAVPVTPSQTPRRRLRSSRSAPVPPRNTLSTT